jgi:hypothetical protein
MVRRMNGGIRNRTMRGGRRTRRMHGGRRTRRPRTRRPRTRRPRTRRPRTRRPRTRRSFMMYGGVRDTASMGGSTFVRHSSLGDAVVELKLLPKDGEEVVSEGIISSTSVTNMKPFAKGADIHYEKMKWEVMVEGMTNSPLPIDGNEFNEESGKRSKIILLFKETTDNGDKLNYKMIHDEKTMKADHPDVLEYVRKLVECTDPNNPPNPE